MRLLTWTRKACPVGESLLCLLKCYNLILNLEDWNLEKQLQQKWKKFPSAWPRPFYSQISLGYLIFKLDPNRMLWQFRPFAQLDSQFMLGWCCSYWLFSLLPSWPNSMQLPNLIILKLLHSYVFLLLRYPLIKKMCILLLKLSYVFSPPRVYITVT